MHDKNIEETKTIACILADICDKNTCEKIKIGDLLICMDSDGFAPLILILSLILILPLPPPLSTLVGLFIMFFSAQMIFGFNNIWFPKFIMEKKINRETLFSAINNTSKYLKKLEKFTKKRLIFMESEVVKKIIGIIIFLLAMISLIPIPFANFIPGLAIILITFGLVSRDGLIMIFGFILGFLSIFAVWALIIFGKVVLAKIIKDFF